MADKKISALTASTTPLAGTEVLPIVQGGSTVKVSVANLTAGRDVSVNGLNASGNVTSKGTAVFFGDGLDNSAYVYATGGPVHIYANAAATFDFTTAGNLKPLTAGKGIDFSANGGDVLTQYDEGTFTATLTSTTGTITLNSAQDLMQYTRIGRMVYVSGQIVVSSVSSPTGILTLGGLPFTVNGSLGELAGRGAITVVAEGVGITVNSVVGYFLTGGTTANIYKYAAGNTANMAADVTASSSFLINMWYVAA
jgi:hypothetical protein